MTTEVLRPRLAPWIVVHAPMSDGAPWIVERPGTNPLRVSEDIGSLLSAVDGRRDVDALAGVLGTRWTPELVGGAVRKLDDLGLLDGAPEPEPEKRVVLVSWTTVRFRLVQATRVLDPLRPLLVRLPGPVMIGLALLLALGGVAALVALPLGDALGSPLPVEAAVWIWGGIMLTTVVHEFGHGATLTHYHGRPGWLGVMLFYLTPACFCEVTDGWRLGRRSQRVFVALAGVAVQASVAGAAALVALVVPAGDARTTLIGFAVVCYLSGAVNLLPFVKLDGYLALMAHLDIPRLRDRAISDARGWLASGRRHQRDLPQRWAVSFGLVCLVFPVLVLALALSRWTHLLLGAGRAGGALVLLIVAALAYSVVRGLVRTTWTARLALLAVAGGAVVAALLSFVPVRNDVQGGYVSDGTSVRLALPTGAADVQSGAQVVLRRNGLVFGTDIGTATVDGRPNVGEVPLGAFMPFRSGTPTEALVVPLRGEAPSGVGAAYVVGEDVPFGAWLADNYLLPAWRQVFGQEES
ncbi:daptide biosynthesis intramembrane metalloprotease [Lentzea sp. BCCO 10_0798]|uniref:Daptide biosynthesis intramembrane metalloprotease n=1 Tax=Lentzea kristufekii TaxID=3095430 RepID=A0ABU4TNX7_9PSEU|nr:daptide biosynthesis intramembrane metalloprotease [Lentzea sp. BCCO 10_0798]MDX8049920.1 daptide biosynthesis intramembrane metalloprotease [Lentzea sp. BCCO 10_0798]